MILAGFRQLEDLPAYYGLANLFIHIPHTGTMGSRSERGDGERITSFSIRGCGCAFDLIQRVLMDMLLTPMTWKQYQKMMYSMAHGDVDLKSFGYASLEIIRSWGADRFGEAVKFAIQAGMSEIGYVH